MNLFVFYFLPSHLSARKKIFFEIFKFSVDERGGRRRNFIAFIEKRKKSTFYHGWVHFKNNRRPAVELYFFKWLYQF